MRRALHISLLVLLVLALCGCDRRPKIKIDRGSVKVEQGRYTGETIDLIFHADLTKVVTPSLENTVHWSRDDGRFHQSETPVDHFFFVYEVFNPFGERDLKTTSHQVGPSKATTLPLPVFSTPEQPYEYTLRVTFYLNSRKQDTYLAKFRLTHPD
jgi:hypothetical protein